MKSSSISLLQATPQPQLIEREADEAIPRRFELRFMRAELFIAKPGRELEFQEIPHIASLGVDGTLASFTGSRLLQQAGGGSGKLFRRRAGGSVRPST